MTKIKVSFHSGKGFAKHNNHYPTKRDKGNINRSLTAQNVTWTCYKGVTDVVEAEKKLYEEMFMEELNIQNKKYRKKGNYGRIRTMDEWMKAERHRPTENIFQIGNMDCYIDPADLWNCYVKFASWRKNTFKDNLILISSVMHVDEATPHIHERYVLYYTDDQGIKHTGMKKSLEQAGVDLPDPSQPESRENYRKITFDAMCREKWQDIVEDVLQNYKDLELDRTVDQERKKYRIGHMGVDSWRACEAAMRRVNNTKAMLKQQEDDLHAKQKALKEEQEALKLQAEAIQVAAKQQNANLTDLAEKMQNVEKREMELQGRERTFKQRVKETVKRRLAAEKKAERIHEELVSYYPAPSYTPSGND